MSLRRKHKEDHAEVDTGPLNDILFILLFFFLIMATVANPYVIKMSTPKAKTDTKSKQSLVVSLNRNGNAYIGQQRIVFDSLELELKRRINPADSSKPAVVINADSLVAWKDIVRIMTIAKRLGATTSASVTNQ
ncbi:MAG: biopolymer transporter ExbD [Chitinophagaceae bacterium]